MKRFNKFLLFSFLPILAVSAASLNQSLGGKEERKKVESKNVPLTSIYSTSGQEELILIKRGVSDKAFPKEMNELYQRAIRTGASNVFLARGDDIAAAVTATWSVFNAGDGVDKPVKRDVRCKSDKIWLVAYLGWSGSEPPQWLVKSVQVKGKKVTLTYKEDGAETLDKRPYLFWVPLGRLDPGTYTVELFDQDRQQVMLLRRVIIPKE